MSLDFLRNVHAPEFPEGLDWIGSEPLRLADLRGLARRRLAACGVHAIAASDACTVSDGARFYSWRRDRGGGRMAALVWLAAPARNGPV